MANDAPKKRGPGRPPGSKNKPLEAVDVVLARCPKCDSTGSKVLSRMKETNHGGTSRITGKRYTTVTVDRVKCVDCSNIYTAHKFHYRPADWK